MPHRVLASSRARFSIIVSAHNEEALLPRGMEALRSAVVRSGSSAEIVVVANRCTDATQSIAEAAGAVVVVHEHRNIAATAMPASLHRPARWW